MRLIQGLAGKVEIDRATFWGLGTHGLAERIKSPKSCPKMIQNYFVFVSKLFQGGLLVGL